MKYWFDTEFLQRNPLLPATWVPNHGPLELLSIGIVNEKNDVEYLVRDDVPLWLAINNQKDSWLRDNVVPALDSAIIRAKYMHISKMAEAIKKFVGNDQNPQFYGYFADYDWVLFTALFGGMLEMPQGWPQYCRDIKQTSDENQLARFPAQTSIEHNALNDAIWTKESHDWMNKTLEGMYTFKHGNVSIGGNVIGSPITIGNSRRNIV